MKRIRIRSMRRFDDMMKFDDADLDMFCEVV